MRILFVNTLRMGDTLMSLDVVESILHKYKVSKVDYLTFDESKPISKIISSEKLEFHYIRRREIQSAILDKSMSIYRPLQELEMDIYHLQKIQYDLIINYSNTLFSTYICNLFKAKKYSGNYLDESGKTYSSSNWTKYLNDISTSSSGFIHFNEVFLKDLNLDINLNICNSLLQETARGKLEVNKFVLNKKYIVINYLTSDVKKDLPLNHLKKLLDELEKNKVSFIIACAPFECEKVQGQLKDYASNIVPCSFEGLLSLLKNASMLVSVDTSVKHIAGLLRLPTIELSFGSSKPNQTGVFNNNSYIIYPTAKCYPCKHSETCHMSDVVCSKEISDNILTDCILSILKGVVYNKDKSNFKNSNFILSKVININGFYFLDSMSENDFLKKINFIKMNSDANSYFKVLHKLAPSFSNKYNSESIISLQRKVENLYHSIKIGLEAKKLIEAIDEISFSTDLYDVVNFKFDVLSQYPSTYKLDFSSTRRLQDSLLLKIDQLKSIRTLIYDINAEKNYE